MNPQEPSNQTSAPIPQQPPENVAPTSSPQPMPAVTPPLPAGVVEHSQPSGPKRSLLKKVLVVLGIVVLLILLAVMALYFVYQGEKKGGVSKADEYVQTLKRGTGSELDEAIYDSNWSLKYLCDKSGGELADFICEDVDNPSETAKKSTIAGAKALLSETINLLQDENAQQYETHFGKNKYDDKIVKVHYTLGDKYLVITVVQDKADDSWHVFDSTLTDTRPSNN